MRANFHSLRFAHIPCALSNCVYVVEFANGTIKVGFTNGPRARLRRLSSQAARAGTVLTRYQVFPGKQSADRNSRHDPHRHELRSISALGAVATVVPGRREYFTGIGYESALAIVSQASGG